ncbi:putative LRR receptor-like serine/threonine-protein kinase [Cinnamomum micranthum f. kanehirae]|uniref:Putative LRR receptor-like serine/threonine-protein kinase n=1 Tax=Cinnamomum micranthum f. kanehirae TaxID=337451 RepID=A0A3S3MA19_9MAGN|nr:putative LRR receptor-like serine/threonine-protein kinase [Cinnamomum micranthum f. kanehirae]
MNMFGNLGLGHIVDVTDDIIAVEFMTKNIWNYYSSGILNLMSGVDLSCNQFTGEIPPEVGQLSGLHSLNLSFNQFIGPIPVAFETLSQIESLDLSYNRLNGTIPSELMKLNFLAVFSVAHNNLSGRIPDMKLQFAPSMKVATTATTPLWITSEQKLHIPALTPSKILKERKMMMMRQPC